MTLAELCRAICCPGGTCIRPERCDANNRNVPVNIPHAAAAILTLLQAQAPCYASEAPPAASGADPVAACPETAKAAGATF